MAAVQLTPWDPKIGCSPLGSVDLLNFGFWREIKLQAVFYFLKIIGTNVVALEVK